MRVWVGRLAESCEEKKHVKNKIKKIQNDGYEQEKFCQDRFGTKHTRNNVATVWQLCRRGICRSLSVSVGGNCHWCVRRGVKKLSWQNCRKAEVYLSSFFLLLASPSMGGGVAQADGCVVPARGLSHPFSARTPEQSFFSSSRS